MLVGSSVFDRLTNTEGSQSIIRTAVTDQHLNGSTTPPVSAAARPFVRIRLARDSSDGMNGIMELLKIQMVQEHERREKEWAKRAECQRCIDEESRMRMDREELLREKRLAEDRACVERDERLYDSLYKCLC